MRFLQRPYVLEEIQRRLPPPETKAGHTFVPPELSVPGPVQNVAADAFAPAPGRFVRSSESRGRDHGVPVITPTVTGTQGSQGVAGGDRGLRFDPS